MQQFHTFLIVLKLVHPRLQAEISHRLMKVQPFVTSCFLVVLLRVVQDCLPSIVLPPLARHLYITGVSTALSLKDVSALWPRLAMSSLRSTSYQQLPLHCPSVDIPGLPLICNPCPTCAPPVQNCHQALHASLGCCYTSVQKKEDPDYQGNTALHLKCVPSGNLMRSFLRDSNGQCSSQRPFRTMHGPKISVLISSASGSEKTHNHTICLGCLWSGVFLLMPVLLFSRDASCDGPRCFRARHCFTADTCCAMEQKMAYT